MSEVITQSSSSEYNFFEAMFLLEMMVKSGELKTIQPIKFAGLIHVAHEGLVCEPNLRPDQVNKAHILMTQIKEAIKDNDALAYKMDQIDRILKILETRDRVESV